MFAIYLLAGLWWYYVCFKNGAIFWSAGIKSWNETWPRFLRAPTWVYSPTALRVFMCIFMVFLTFGLILALISNVLKYPFKKY